MKSTDPIEVEKIPFSEPREEPKQEKIVQSENTVYDDLGFLIEDFYPDTADVY